MSKINFSELIQIELNTSVLRRLLADSRDSGRQQSERDPQGQLLWDLNSVDHFLLSRELMNIIWQLLGHSSQQPDVDCFERWLHQHWNAELVHLWNPVERLEHYGLLFACPKNAFEWILRYGN